jgi:thiol-disulfide isomerase/thioredoxin
VPDPRTACAVYDLLPLALLAVLFFAGCNRSTTPEQPPAPQSSSKTHEDAVQLRAIESGEFPRVIEEHRGKALFVDCWATWCGYCIKDFPHTVEFHRRLAGRGLDVVTVSFDSPDDLGAAQDFLVKQRATMKNYILRDAGSAESFAALGVKEGLPFYKLYDRKGALRQTFVGAGQAEAINRAVEALLNE